MNFFFIYKLWSASTWRQFKEITWSEVWLPQSKMMDYIIVIGWNLQQQLFVMHMHTVNVHLNGVSAEQRDNWAGAT